MAKEQFFGIKYPLENEDEYYYLDLNKNTFEETESELLHLIFTPKGQRIRKPDFGTNLIKFIFSPNDNLTMEDIKNDISSNVEKYIPNVIFDNIKIIEDEGNDNLRIVSIDYIVKEGNNKYKNNVSIRI